MKFTAHAKTFKPEEPPSVQTKPLITGHAHVHTPPHLMEAVAPLKSVKNYSDWVPISDPAQHMLIEEDNLATKAYVDKQISQFVGGPVFMGIDHAAVKPESISVTQALDALKHHGVYWKDLTVHHTPEGTELQANLMLVPSSKEVMIELESWFIK